ncbi:Rft protein-domain-containing protein [Syncephalastrum racemosum]|uniref:Man(5)GlcNAc(2)-PP-dolichol translocation protein RFT1 n=1 Tax=Syncephalastrum racemosum TaxID=13706 RepID=A0A1X2HLH2_SYNRA|nr:Rft protein-domain-containing protein [Syncephalastrum racemosum]
MDASKKTDDQQDALLQSTAKGAYYLVLLQFASRMLTFGLHQVVLRYTTAETLGIASVKLELLLSTILFISREGFRCALLREQKREDEQKVTNLSYIPVAVGLVTTVLACGYYLLQIDDTTYPHYRLSVVLFGLSALSELCAEPLFVLAMNRFYFRLRVTVEGVAVVTRCLITFSWTLFLGGGVLAFAVAQAAFGVLMLVGYVIFFLNEAKAGRVDPRALLPRRLINGRWFDPPMLNLATTLTKQSLLKHVLTEGDKMLISALSSDENQGVYAFVVNYGSLVVRILFQPLEETSRTLFSKLLATKTPSSMATASDMLMTLLRCHVLLGFVFTCFATNYTRTLIDLLVGKEWSTERDAPAVLAIYCMYVPIMGINGVTEAFVQAVASKSDLSRLSYYMVGFSACFMFSGYLFMSLFDMGAIGLVLANMVNLGIRIAYSWHYIKRYFGKNMEIGDWLPRLTTTAAFISAWFLTRWSENAIGWATFQQKIMHIAVSGLAFLAVTALTLWVEKDWIRQVRQLLLKRKQD